MFGMGNGRKSTLRSGRRLQMSILKVFLKTKTCGFGICGLILGVERRK